MPQKSPQISQNTHIVILRIVEVILDPHPESDQDQNLLTHIEGHSLPLLTIHQRINELSCGQTSMADHNTCSTCTEACW